MTFQSLPTCLQDLCTDFAFRSEYRFVQYDVDRCAMIQECVPPSFVVAVVFHKDRWGYINSPFRKGNAYFPTWRIDQESVWNGVPAAFACALHRQRVRGLRTYKGIIFRRLDHMLKHNFGLWNETYTKVFSKLKPCHFRKNAQRSFVEVILAEISEASLLPENFFVAPPS